mmetsp:Transcript_9467/g.28236  ORF Transcript_9467/g.28236 Transcript_9467/m.28236 type:complete len:248 (-) Transcript_9467:310-1053(-)
MTGHQRFEIVFQSVTHQNLVLQYFGDLVSAFLYRHSIVLTLNVFRRDSTNVRAEIRDSHGDLNKCIEDDLKVPIDDRNPCQSGLFAVRPNTHHLAIQRHVFGPNCFGNRIQLVLQFCLFFLYLFDLLFLFQELLDGRKLVLLSLFLGRLQDRRHVFLGHKIDFVVIVLVVVDLFRLSDFAPGILSKLFRILGRNIRRNQNIESPSNLFCRQFKGTLFLSSRICMGWGICFCGYDIGLVIGSRPFLVA